MLGTVAARMSKPYGQNIPAVYREQAIFYPARGLNHINTSTDEDLPTLIDSILLPALLLFFRFFLFRSQDPD